MTKHIRFSLQRDLLPTTPDASPYVRHGVLDGETVRENESQQTYALGEVRLLPPCSPTKIVCVGRNYREHASELGNVVPSEPLIFLKPPSALIAHGDPIVWLPASRRVDYEGELAVVIGKRARRVSAAEANDYILGYTCLNDVTARDLQKKDGQWTRGKGFDTSCPLGPWMARKEEVEFASLRVRTYVDGELRQDGAVTEMIFPIPDIIAYITAFMTLEPGDVIATGTPAGVGTLKPGCTVRVEIQGIGALENRVISA